MDFFQELRSLQLKTPRIGSIRINPQNSEYTHNTKDCKNCYLIANAVGNEDCMYGRDFYSNQDCIDCDHILHCTLCYECVNAKNCYNCLYLQDCEDCLDCEFGYDLKGCKNCLGCVGLRRKEFHIFNEPYSKKDFFEKKKALIREEIKKRFEELKTKIARKALEMIASEKSLGDYLYHSKNAFYCFDIIECHDVGYVYESKRLKDCWDIAVLEDSELCYDCSSNHHLHNCNFCFMCVDSSDLEYCDTMFYCRYCFGCVGLIRKEYHILNKPYSRDEYFKKVAEIKDQLKKDGTYGRQYLESTFPFEDTVASWEKM